jgi:hypothetical protein
MKENDKKADQKFAFFFEMSIIENAYNSISDNLPIR